MIRARGPGLMREVAAPAYGRQDTGHAPGGPQDRFSWECARILLGEAADIRTWEVILPPVLEADVDCIGVCTGASFDRIEVSGREVPHGTVFRLRKGEQLRCGIRKLGFRTLLALRPFTRSSEACLGRKRGPFRERARWPDPEGALRVVPGPEAEGLRDPVAFLDAPWVTGLDSNDHGLRLKGGPADACIGPVTEMVSAPVADGTLQFTPDGLILLLRCRSTLGGYPRVFNVIQPDIDAAAQLPPRRRVRFRLCDPAEARQVREQHAQDLDRLRVEVFGNRH